MLKRTAFSRNISHFNIIMDNKVKSLLSDYTKMVVCNLVAFFTNSHTFSIYLQKEEGFQKYFTIRTLTKEKININFVDDFVYVSYHNTSYKMEYIYGLEDLELQIKEVIFYGKNTIIETYDSHLVTFKITFENRVYELKIPMETEAIIKPELLNGISSVTSIQELRELYCHIFLPLQNEYDLKRCETILSIYDLTDDYTRDSIHLMNNIITYYCFSNKIGDTILNVSRKINENPIVSMSNVTSVSAINFDKEIRSLLKKAENYNESKIIDLSLALKKHN